MLLASPEMIRPLPGTPSSLRAQATALRTMRGRLSTARRAAARLEGIAGGAVWTGSAHDAFRQALGRKPVPEDLLDAMAVMDRAAGSIDAYAVSLQRAQDDIWWCRSRLRSLGVDGLVPPELAGEVQGVLHDAAQAVERERAARRVLQDGFDLYDDQTVYATPPPSMMDRVGGVVTGLGEVVWDFGAGSYEGTRDMVVGVVTLAYHLHPLRLPHTLREAWNHRDEIRAVVSYAIDDPTGFATQVGRVLVDWDTLRENPARWLGRLVPELLVTVFTAGAGRAATTAGRMNRVVRLVDDAGDVTSVSRRAADVLDPRFADRVTGLAPNLERARHARDLAVPYLRGMADEFRTTPATAARDLLNDVPRGVELAVEMGTGGVLRTDGVGAVGRHLPRAVASFAVRDAVTLGVYSRLRILDRWVNGFPTMSLSEQTVLVGGTGILATDTARTLSDVGAAVLSAERCEAGS